MFIISTQLKVLTKCAESLELVTLIKHNVEINPIVKRMTDVLEERIKSIHEICSIEKYNIYFIGEVGVGKSTAISNLLGLIDNSKLSIGNNLNDIPILKTAEGRTTLCETEIHFDQSDDATTQIEIIALENEKFEKIVSEFCLNNLKLEELKDKKDGNSPVEVQRVIENMSNFPTDNLQNQIEFIKEQLNTDNITTDELLSGAKKAILKSINYEDRNTLIFQFDKNNQTNVKHWIKDTFSKINDGEIPDAPYPTKLIIRIAKNQWDLNIPSVIKIVKDTRGMDGLAAREDLTDAIKDFQNICVICDRVSNYGNIVSNTFFKNHFDSKDKDLKHRSIVLGLEQGAQLSKVNKARGRENGKERKKEESLPSWNEISLDENNMLFYNAFFGIKYDSDEYEILKIDEEQYKAEHQSIWDEISLKINKMYASYDSELKSIHKQLEVFSQNQIEIQHLEKIMLFKDYVNNCINNLEENYSAFFDKLNIEIREYTHPGHLRGSVNNNGKYINYNLYSQAKNISYEDFDRTTKELIVRLEERCTYLFNNDDEMEKTLKETILELISATYKKSRNNNALDYEKILEEKIYTDPVWNELTTYWGNKISGYKYRDRIADTLFNTIRNKNYIEEILQKRNTAKFFIEIQTTLNL